MIPSSITTERAKKAKNMAYFLYKDLGELGAREYIKNMLEEVQDEEDRKFWVIVNNRLSDLVYPVHRKPKPYKVRPDQCSLYGRRGWKP